LDVETFDRTRVFISSFEEGVVPNQKIRPSPLGRRWRAAPDEGSPPHDFVDL
jgi:hypothetical protein